MVVDRGFEVFFEYYKGTPNLAADLIQVGVSEGAAALLLSPAVGRCGRACSAVLIQVGVSDGAAAALPLMSPLSPESAEASALVAALPRC